MTKVKNTSVVDAVESAISFLIGSCGLFELESFDLAEDELPERIADLVATDKISVGFFGEDNNLDLSIGDFLTLVAECASLEDCRKGFLRTNTFAIQKVGSESEEAVQCLYEGCDLALVDQGVSFQVTDCSFITGFHALQIGAFHEDVVPPVTGHTVVELDYSRATRTRSREVDVQLIDAYLFELAASHNIVLIKEEFSVFGEPDQVDCTDSGRKYLFRPLECSNEGLQLYLTASVIVDPELRFLSMFKVLEWISPVVANLDAADAMRKKLDTPEALKPTGAFLREVFELAKDFDARRNDRDQIKAVLTETIDLVRICEKLPPFLKRELTHMSTAAEHDRVARDVSECLCATRNQVAHAKSNYTLKGTECPVDQLPALNIFLDIAAVQVIRWFNRLPEHRRTFPNIVSKP